MFSEFKTRKNESMTPFVFAFFFPSTRVGYKAYELVNFVLRHKNNVQWIPLTLMDDLWTHSLRFDWNPPSQTIDSSTNRFLSLTAIRFLKILHLKTHKLMHMHKKVSSLFRYWASDGYCLPGLVILSTKFYLIPT